MPTSARADVAPSRMKFWSAGPRKVDRLRVEVPEVVDLPATHRRRRIPALSAPIVAALERDSLALGVDASTVVLFKPRRLARRRRIRTFTDPCIATGIGLHLLHGRLGGQPIALVRVGAGEPTLTTCVARTAAARSFERPLGGVEARVAHAQALTVVILRRRQNVRVAWAFCAQIGARFRPRRRVAVDARVEAGNVFGVALAGASRTWQGTISHELGRDMMIDRVRITISFARNASQRVAWLLFGSSRATS